MKVAIEPFLDAIKEEHPKATHYCYAYVYDEVKHSSDDGEPGGTAGLPILNVLEKEELNHTLVVVVRYFGGIKLGAGGLVRAYTKATTDALKTTTYDLLIPGKRIALQFPYEEKNILYILGDSTIEEKKYLENVTYTCMVDLDVLEKLEKYHPSILEDCLIKKVQ